MADFIRENDTYNCHDAGIDLCMTRETFDLDLRFNTMDVKLNFYITPFLFLHQKLITLYSQEFFNISLLNNKE